MSIPDKQREKILGAKLQALLLKSSCLAIGLGTSQRAVSSMGHIWTHNEERALYIFLVVDIWLSRGPAGWTSMDTSSILTSKIPRSLE